MITRDKMITREQACNVLLDIISKDILREEYVEALEDTVRCLNMESKMGISPWGMSEDDYGMMVIAINTDAPEYEEHMAKCAEIEKQYRLKVGE